LTLAKLVKAGKLMLFPLLAVFFLVGWFMYFVGERTIGNYHIVPKKSKNNFPKSETIHFLTIDCEAELKETQQ